MKTRNHFLRLLRRPAGAVSFAVIVLYFLTAAFLLPETKGKTLEEIERFFEK